MCGIAGYILKNSTRSVGDIKTLLDPMLQQRGPDDEGVCLISTKNRLFRAYSTGRTVAGKFRALPHIYDGEAPVEHDIGLVHTRYAIIDLTEGGHQPFTSRDGSVTAVFNGEIYNYPELREELLSLGVQFTTASDTEVLVEGYCRWGEELWPKMNGFWAVALYDTARGTLVLSRDRIGVAPLYYAETEKGFFFASYIQPLIEILGGNVSFDMDAVSGFIRTGFKDLDDSTFYPEIKSLPARSTVTFNPGRCAIKEAGVRQYWDFPGTRLRSDEISLSDAVTELRSTFFDAVNIRLRSDVKVAFELSGGLDSSSVVAAASALRGNDVTTYTVKVRGADEEPFARALSEKYPIDYRVLADLESDLAKEALRFAGVMEEPYDNPGSYNHHRMLKTMKAEGVGVVVTGAGGDEVFAGYDTSFWPAVYRELRAKGMTSYIKADWHEFRRRFMTARSASGTLKHYSLDPFKVFTREKKVADIALTCRDSTLAVRYREMYKGLSFHQRVLFHYKVALVPYYMRCTDHYTMGIPIEHRFPFADYRVIEFGLKMPPEYLFRNGWTKYILRKAMEPYLPKKIVWRRKKMGFPFAYRAYLAANRAVFEHYLDGLEEIGLSAEFRSGVYGRLLKEDPQLLWRLLSTAIWVRHGLEKGRVK